MQRSPKNAPAIARILLEAGAEVDAMAPIYDHDDTTLCLTVTSVHPYLAGVQASLVDVLVDYGARVDGLADDGAPLGCALLFGYREAAERLVLRGARVDNLIYAAGLGRTDVVRQMLATGTGTDRIARRTDGRAGRFSFPVARDADAREVAMIVAAMHGRLATLRESGDFPCARRARKRLRCFAPRAYAPPTAFWTPSTAKLPPRATFAHFWRSSRKASPS